MYDIRPITMNEVRALCERFHGYGSSGSVAVYAFGVYEGETLVAAYAWQPPPVGAAKSICPEAPAGVLALSRMVAVPKSERALAHVSKPLRVVMRRMIDRTRWPVLVTYSDEGQGHTGHVYKCSGWQKTVRNCLPFYVDAEGKRVSCYSAGKTDRKRFKQGGVTYLQRWEHRACPAGETDKFMHNAGWRRVPIPGKVWRSGAPAHRWERVSV